MSGRERLLDLLATRATEGLSEAGSREVDHRLCAWKEFEADGIDLAAAAADLAFASASSDLEAMPESLKQTVLGQAQKYLDSRVSNGAESRPSSVTPFPPRHPT